MFFAVQMFFIIVIVIAACDKNTNLAQKTSFSANYLIKII